MLIDEVPTIFITYKFRKENNEKKIFGKSFANRYKDVCKIEINDTEYKLNEYVLINNDNIIKNNNEELLIIKLKDINKINNISYMFDKCSSLISIYCSEILIFRN